MEQQKTWDWEQIDKDWSRGEQLRALRNLDRRHGDGHGVNPAAIKSVLNAIDELGYGKPVQASREEIARVSWCSVSVVQRAIEVLCNIHFLVRRPIVDHQGQQANRFQIVWPNLLDPPDVEPTKFTKSPGGQSEQGRSQSDHPPCSTRPGGVVNPTRGGGQTEPAITKDLRNGSLGTHGSEDDLVFKNKNFKTKSSAPDWPRTIPPAALGDPAALQELYRRAVACGFVAETDQGRLVFFTLANYCGRQQREGKTRNPLALLTSNLRTGRKFGDHNDEAAARKMIKTVDGYREQPRTSDLSACDPADRGRQLEALRTRFQVAGR